MEICLACFMSINNLDGIAIIFIWKILKDRSEIIMKKIISAILSVTLTVSCALPAFATSVCEDASKPEVVTTEQSCTVTTCDEEYVYSTTYYFETSQFSFVKSDRMTGEPVFTYQSSVNDGIEAYATTTEETFTGYAYYITETSQGTEYKLNMPASEQKSRFLWVDTVYFKAYYNLENRSYLSEFRSAVDTLDDLEKAFIVASGAAIGKDVINLFAWATATGPLTKALISSLLGALGLTAAQYAAAEALASGTNRCYYAWNDAFDFCQGIFY